MENIRCRTLMHSQFLKHSCEFIRDKKNSILNRVLFILVDLIRVKFSVNSNCDQCCIQGEESMAQSYFKTYLRQGVNRVSRTTSRKSKISSNAKFYTFYHREVLFSKGYLISPKYLVYFISSRLPRVTLLPVC